MVLFFSYFVIRYAVLGNMSGLFRLIFILCQFSLKIIGKLFPELSWIQSNNELVWQHCFGVISIAYTLFLYKSVFFLECPKMTFQRSLKSSFSWYLLQFKEFLDHIFRADVFLHDDYEDIGFGVVWHEKFQKIKIFYFLSYLPFKTILSSNSFGNLLLIS